jgi:hypothetical protein
MQRFAVSGLRCGDSVACLFITFALPFIQPFDLFERGAIVFILASTLV